MQSLFEKLKNIKYNCICVTYIMSSKRKIDLNKL